MCMGGLKKMLAKLLFNVVGTESKRNHRYVLSYEFTSIDMASFFKTLVICGHS